VPDYLPDDAYPRLRWVDAFPWIEAAASDLLTAVGTPWWLEPVPRPGTALRGERLADLSDLMLERLTRWTIGQIFPNLPVETALTRLFITNRARNALARFGYETAGDLQDLEIAELFDLPNVGIGTVDSILQALADASTLNPAPIFSTRQGEAIDAPVASRDDEDSFPHRTGQIIADLRTLAGWYAALGMPSRPLLDNPVPPGSPPDVIKARQRLELVSAGDVLAETQAGLDVAEQLERLINALDDRARQILARRFFADRPETLDEIGLDLDVSRERVRQIESRARADVVQALESSSLGAVIILVRDMVGIVLPLGDLLNVIPALARKVRAVGQPAWRVLDRLDDAYEIKDGWCAAPTILSAQTETLTRLQEYANRHGVAAISDLPVLNPNLPAESAAAPLREWLRYCGFIVDGDHIFTRIQSVGDRAAAILSVTGSPMSSQGILDRLGIERSLGSLRNAMVSDDRFERVDRDKWSLAEWGLESYSGIRAVVSEEIARSGGQVRMDTLIERITGMYTVSANSVIAYASAPPFEAKGGIVRLANGDRDTRKTPERTRRLYRRADGWLYRVMVTKEHLRGSGSPAPTALAVILGLQHGQARQLESALGPQTISWVGPQPTFGTIRRFLVDSDIEIGSQIFLVIGDDGSFRIEPIIGDDIPPLEGALRLAGATLAASREPPRAALAAAIRLPEESPAASVIGGYRDRGDTDIAELLLSVRDQLDELPSSPEPTPSADINEILNLL
jgi:Sigma-70, region 4/Bacterial RNA polymerase, alpha chain C terminal domain